MSGVTPSAFWPGTSMALLLKAAFHTNDAAAIDAWREWENTVDFDAAGWSEIRLSPSAARRMSALGVPAVNQARINGIKRFVWTSSQATLHAVRPAIAALRDADIPLVVIKGGVRHAVDGLHSTERHIGDLDVVLPKLDFFKALDVAESIGWPNKWGKSREHLREHFMSSRHSIEISSDGERCVDLHIHSLLPTRCPDHDDGLWRRALPGSINGVDVQVPSPADILVAAIVHGQLHDPGGTMDWVSDGWEVMTQRTIDWDAFIEDVGHRSVWVFAHVALENLKHQLGWDVPEDVRVEIRQKSLQPFVDEYDGLYNNWTADLRSIHRRWGDAMQIRARQSLDRMGKDVSGNSGYCERSDAYATSERPGVLCLAVPDQAKRAGQTCTLALDFAALWRPGKTQLDICVVCFRYHSVELTSVEVSSSERLKWTWSSLHKSMQFSTDILVAHDVTELEIQLKRPDSMELARVSPGALAVEWQFENTRP